MEFDHVRRHVPPTILDDVKDGIQLDIHVLCTFQSK